MGDFSMKRKLMLTDDKLSMNELIPISIGLLMSMVIVVALSMGVGAFVLFPIVGSHLPTWPRYAAYGSLIVLWGATFRLVFNVIRSYLLQQLIRRRAFFSA